LLSAGFLNINCMLINFLVIENGPGQLHPLITKPGSASLKTRVIDPAGFWKQIAFGEIKARLPCLLAVVRQAVCLGAQTDRPEACPSQRNEEGIRHVQDCD